MRIIAVIVISIAGAAAMASAQLAAPSVVASGIVVDDAGNRLPVAPPARRIVSLAPHATELLFAAGAGAAIVGVVAHSDWPPEARRLPQVGDAGALDLERIAALAPDLVVAWPYTAPAYLAALRAREVRVFVSDPQSIAGIAADIEKLGALAGTPAVANAAAATLRARLAALAVPRRATPLRVFYQIWNAPLYTVGGRHLISEAIAICGGQNVFAQLTLPAPAVTVEAVLAAQPDVIVGGSDDGSRPPWLDAWNRWRTLPAVRNGNLFVASGDLMHRPGPRFVDGVAALCSDLARAVRVTPAGTPSLADDPPR